MRRSIANRNVEIWMVEALIQLCGEPKVITHEQTSDIEMKRSETSDSDAVVATWWTLKL